MRGRGKSSVVRYLAEKTTITYGGDRRNCRN